jgi:hypothetical protein
MALLLRKTDPHIEVLAKAVNGLKTQIGAGAHFHLDASEISPAHAAATDLPTAVQVINEVEAVYHFHTGDRLAHAVPDTTNVESTAKANASVTDGGLAGAMALANDQKAKFNAHLTQSTVHYNNDGTNAVAAANATDLPSLITLVNALRTSIIAHMANAPAAPSLRVVPG